MKKKVLLFASLCLMLLLISCGGKHPAVKDFEESMKIIQSGNYGKEANLSNGVDSEIFSLIEEGSKKITYKINKTETKKDEAILNVTMKAPDLTGVQQEMLQKFSTLNPNEFLDKTEAETEKFGQDLVKNLIKEKLNSPDLKFMEETFDVIYKKDGNKWIMDPMSNPKFIKMTSLGMFSTGN